MAMLSYPTPDTAGAPFRKTPILVIYAFLCRSVTNQRRGNLVVVRGTKQAYLNAIPFLVSHSTNLAEGEIYIIEGYSRAKPSNNLSPGLTLFNNLTLMPANVIVCHTALISACAARNDDEGWSESRV